MTRVLAVDPGPQPGMALWEGDRFQCWMAEDWYQGCAIVRGYLAREGVDAVVFETFQIVAGSGRGKPSNQTIEMIGVMRWLCHEHGVSFIGQAPADARSFSTQDKLKRLGWETPANPDHARSAARHLLLYLVRSHLLSADRLLA